MATLFVKVNKIKIREKIRNKKKEEVQDMTNKLLYTYIVLS